MNTLPGWNGQAVSLQDCPFCGGEPTIKHIGNEHTKKRKIEIKCKLCRVSRIDAALSRGFEWLEKAAADNWNQKPSI